MIRKSIVLLISTSLLGGCMAFRGPEPVMLRGNVMHRDRDAQRSGHLYERFRIATREAAGCREELPPQDRNATASVPPPELRCPLSLAVEASWPEDERRRRMAAFMNAGYDLIYAECADYFDAMGRRQRGTQILAATIGPISTLISGIVGLTRPDDSETRDAVQAGLSIVTNGATAALSIYDQHFLFGSDNIDAVRARVQDALRAHALRTLDMKVDSFGRAAGYIVDNQAICGPSSILSIVRQSIAGATMQANAPQDSAGQNTQAPPQVQGGPTPRPPENPQPPVMSDRVEVRVSPQ